MNDIRPIDSKDWKPERPPGPIEGADAWLGADMAKSDEWIHHLTDQEIAELEGAARGVIDRGLELLDVGKEEFPLPAFGPVLSKICEEVLRGRGFDKGQREGCTGHQIFQNRHRRVP